MADTQNNLEQEVESIILASFSQSQQEPQDVKANIRDETANTEPGDADEQPEGKRVLHVDKYSLPDGNTLYRFPTGEAVLVPGSIPGDDPTPDNPLDANAVESMAPATDTYPITETEPPQEQKSESAPTSTKRRMKSSSVLVPLVLFIMVAMGTVSYFFLLPLTASATITITPTARSLHTATTFTIAANPKAAQVQGRPLEAISFTKSKTVPATGHAQEPAIAAAGVLTFYNADFSQSYTIPAGVTFTTQSGATIVTDKAVTVQAAVLPEVGIAIAPAHVIQAGSAGNIPPHAIYTRCCGSQFLTATNATPFSGGQDARTYSFIQTSDIQNAAGDLLSSLTPQATVQLTKQARTGEQLVTPLCSPRIQESAEPGTESADVTVSVTQQCTSVAYMLDSLQQVATSTLAHMVTLPHFEEVGTTQVTVNGSTYASHTATLKVSLSGVWLYHFTQAQLTQLTHLIAGESQAKAHATLARGDGIASVSIHIQRLDFKDILPTNPRRITMQLFYLVS